MSFQDQVQKTLDELVASGAELGEPGTKTGYHAYTFGYLAGEIVRRSTGRPLADVLRERIAAPLGFPDELFFGMPEDKRGSLATLVDAPSEVDWSTMQLPEDLPMFRAAPMSLFPNADLGNDPEVSAPIFLPAARPLRGPSRRCMRLCSLGSMAFGSSAPNGESRQRP